MFFFRFLFVLYIVQALDINYSFFARFSLLIYFNFYHTYYIQNRLIAKKSMEYECIVALKRMCVRACKKNKSQKTMHSNNNNLYKIHTFFHLLFQNRIYFLQTEQCRKHIYICIYILHDFKNDSTQAMLCCLFLPL